MTTIHRNEPCPCGSGKRYKACCGRLGDEAQLGYGWNAVILDDYFPNLLTGFRVAEYNALLESMPGLGIMSINNDFHRVAEEYFERYPQYRERIRPFDQIGLLGVKLAYITFLNNANTFLPYLEYFGIPFVLQLYPGGGLGLYNPESDAKLDRICNSPLLRRVITTQTITEDYLRERYAGRVPTELVFGAVFCDSTRDLARADRPYFGAGKAHLDVCFCAFKYTPRAADKGYPEFIQAAHQIAARSDSVRFHVIGNLDSTDIDVAMLGNRIEFHGQLQTADLRRRLHEMDLIVSPNQPSLIYQGNFDGFPTGAVTEAALAGVGMMVTDPLGLNAVFPEGDAICIIEPTAESIYEEVLRFLNNPAALQSMARNGKALSAEIYSPERQIGTRLRILTEELGASVATARKQPAPLILTNIGPAELTHEIRRILGLMVVDTGGGCPVDKALYMAKLIVDHGMNRTVEIGVYRGRSLIPQALAHKRTGGMVIGIDPYERAAAHEDDVAPAIKGLVKYWLDTTNFDDVFSELSVRLERLDLTRHARLLRMNSAEARKEVQSPIDMLHIDGNHDSRFVLEDIENYLPIVRPGGFIIMDDIDWPSVAACLPRLDGQCDLVTHFGGWGVWRKHEAQEGA